MSNAHADLGARTAAVMQRLNDAVLGARGTLRTFCAFTTSSGPRDITLQDLHAEAFYPADEASASQRLYGR